MKVAILGSGNIGTDLMIKILRASSGLELAAVVGIDPASDGLARAKALGVETVLGGMPSLRSHASYADIDLVFDATSAREHRKHARMLAHDGKRAVDLTPAAIGPAVVPVANLVRWHDAPNINMTTCGGQATIPIVWAVSQTGARIYYAEMVSSISSRSAGPGTRANIDEFTRTTARGLEEIGNADRGKAIIILNPAEPPIMMRNTVYVLCEPVDAGEVSATIERVAEAVRSYVPGYRLVAPPLFEEVSVRMPASTGRDAADLEGMKVTCLLEVAGAGHYLPPFAGNLDIMTSAALRVGEMIAQQTLAVG